MSKIKEKELERIGVKKKYKGIFSLHRTDNFFNYVDAPVVNGYKFGKVNPRVYLNCYGVYVGEGLFAITDGVIAGDLFKEKQLSTNKNK